MKSRSEHHHRLRLDKSFLLSHRSSTFIDGQHFYGLSQVESWLSQVEIKPADGERDWREATATAALASPATAFSRRSWGYAPLLQPTSSRRVFRSATGLRRLKMRVGSARSSARPAPDSRVHGRFRRGGMMHSSSRVTLRRRARTKTR